ncbi:MAG: cytochrome P450 [Deltaproteobacteria bacterium]|nr:cytochrome P450 [Deltaproteobacteria bacterium]
MESPTLPAPPTPETLTAPSMPKLGGGWPLVGHNFRRLFWPMEFLTDLSGLQGDLAWVSMGRNNWSIYALNPSLYDVLKDKSCSVRHYFEVAPTLLGKSLLTQDGEPHRSGRNAMNKPFTPSGLSAQGTSEIMKEVIERQVGVMLQKPDPLALIEMRTLALDIIFRILGIPHDELDGWREHYEEVMLTLSPVKLRFPGSPEWRAERARAWITERIQTRIAAIRQDPAITGLLAEMVRGWDAQELRGDDGGLIDNVLLLALAGHETTASTMTWMACHLAQDPALWDRVVAEAQAVGAVPQHPKDLAQFPLIEGLFRECLRLYPPVTSISRRLLEPVEIAEVTVPAGAEITFPILSWNRDARHYPDPERFTPDRWVGRERRPSPLETIAFSFGPHFCLGYHVAWTESVQLGVALALQASAKGLRPAMAEGFPKAKYVGLCTPEKKGTRLKWVAA